jgi:hypothetical protein
MAYLTNGASTLSVVGCRVQRAAFQACVGGGKLPVGRPVPWLPLALWIRPIASFALEPRACTVEDAAATANHGHQAGQIGSASAARVAQTVDVIP